MKKTLSVLALLIFLGCAHVPIEYPKRMTLRHGMAKQEVLKVMGPPARHERYIKTNETIVDYLIYEGFTPYEKETPICFMDNQLAGWGRTFYEDRVSTNGRRLK